MKKLSKYILALNLFLLVHCTFNIDNCTSQWIQQNVPFTSGYFHDMKFVNANTGFISNSTPLFIKTTNAGFNWQVLNNYNITSISTVDSMYIYGAGHRNGHSLLYKSTNCGLSWDSLLPYSEYYASIYFFNRDTGLISGFDGFNDVIWRTTNGGQTSSLITTINWTSFTKLFFLKEKVNGEYWGIIYNGPAWYKTTNSGVNWQVMADIPTSYEIGSIFFINQDTGWASISSQSFLNYVFYTTNGGNSWITQVLPYTNPVYYSNDIYFANPRKGWIGFINNICATTNGGLNWGIQTTPGGTSGKLFFLDSLTGWAQTSWNTISHTTNGGGAINKITNNKEQISNNYILYQNYPNPFNPSTNIKYQISDNKYITIKIFDVLGKEIATLVNEKQKAGEYEITFDGAGFSSGVYYYVLYADGVRVDARRMALIK